MSRRHMIGALGVGAVTASPLRRLMAQVADLADRQRLNVLWIGVDDLRCGLGCYGDPHVLSPHIDALASRGVLFQNAHVQQAVCAASRASFLTGCRPDTTTVDYPYNDYFIKEFLPSHPSLPRYFADWGYHTRWGGKIHHNPTPDLGGVKGEPLVRWQRPWWNGYALAENAAKAEASQKDKSIRPPAYESADVPDDAYVDGALADGTVLAIREAAGRNEPFFLTPGFVKPHLPFCCPNRYWDLYRRENLPLPEVSARPAGAPAYAPATFELPTYEGGYGTADKPVPDELAATLRHGYYACTSYIDAQVGKLTTELDARSLWDRTIVVLWSDHGFHLGENGAWGKHMNYEWSTHSPLIVWAPGMTGNGKACPGLVEYVDMFPTLCELAGLPLPSYLEGTSMVPLLDNPARAWKSAAFSQYPRADGLEGRAIRTDRYRYVEWSKEGQAVARELYDHRPDPDEMRSVADEQPETVAELSRRLAAGWKNALPPA